MTSPNGTGIDPVLNGLLGDSSTTNSDGTPNFPGLIDQVAASGSIGSSGSSSKVSIWNTNQKIWFDTSHPKMGVNSTDQTLNTRTGQTTVSGRASGARGSTQITATPGQIKDQFAAMSLSDPAGYLQLQQALASGPWGSVYVNGAFDNRTKGALANAISNYEDLTSTGAAISFKDYLLQQSQEAAALGNPGKAGGSGGGGAASQVNLTDPESIRAAAQQAAQQALGQGLTSTQLDQFVNQFQASQAAAQTSTASSATTPDLSAEAMQFAQQADPGAYKQNQQQSYLSALVNMMGGSRPSTTPTAAA